MTIVNLRVIHTGEISGERLGTSMMIAVVDSHKGFFSSKKEERLVVGILPSGYRAKWYWQENMEKLSWLDSLRATRLAREWFRSKEQEEHINRICKEVNFRLKYKSTRSEN